MDVSYRDLRQVIGAVAPETIAALAPLVVAASRPFADWYFGDADVAAEILEEWMERPTSEVFAGRAIVAEDDSGLVAGCIIALSGAELGRCRAADFGAFCAEISDEPEADDVIADIIEAGHELFLPVADDDLYISRVSVDPRVRGSGVGRGLVARAAELGRALGLRQCRLDVSVDNPAAIRAYEASGLSVITVRESTRAGLRYCAMVMDLSQP